MDVGGYKVVYLCARGIGERKKGAAIVFLLVLAPTTLHSTPLFPSFFLVVV